MQRRVYMAWEMHHGRNPDLRTKRQKKIPYEQTKETKEKIIVENKFKNISCHHTVGGNALLHNKTTQKQHTFRPVTALSRQNGIQIKQSINQAKAVRPIVSREPQRTTWLCFSQSDYSSGTDVAALVVLENNRPSLSHPLFETFI
jgi:hypothetical protein